MPKCDNCGHEAPEGVSFCPECGGHMPGPAAAAPATPPATTPEAPSAAAPPDAKAPTKPKSKGWMWACGGCGCVALIVIIVLGIILGMAAWHTGTGELEQEGIRIDDADETAIDDGAPIDIQVDEDDGWSDDSLDDGEVQGVDNELILEYYQLEIPDGWEQIDGYGSNDTVLIGPEVEGGNLNIAIYLTEFDSPTSLEEFAANEIGTLPGTPEAEDTKADLDGIPAHMALFTGPEDDTIVLACVHGDIGLTVSVWAPSGQLMDNLDEFDRVFDTFSIYRD